MRHRFVIQVPIGAVAIKDIEFDLTSRHELVPILMALQYLYLHRKDALDITLGLFILIRDLTFNHFFLPFADKNRNCPYNALKFT